MWWIPSARARPRRERRPRTRGPRFESMNRTPIRGLLECGGKGEKGARHRFGIRERIPRDGKRRRRSPLRPSNSAAALQVITGMPPVAAPDRGAAAATDSRQSARAAGAGGVALAERRANLRFTGAGLAGYGQGQMERKAITPVQSSELRITSGGARGQTGEGGGRHAELSIWMSSCIASGLEKPMGRDTCVTKVLA